MVHIKAGGCLVAIPMLPLQTACQGTGIMIKKIAHLAMAASLLAATAITTAPQAEARGGRVVSGVIAGTVLGLGIAGAFAGPRYYGRCYPGRRVCDVVGQRCWYNRYGEYVCKDNVRCYRREVCD